MQRTNCVTPTNIIYHSFLLCYKATSRIIYGFVEGKDDPAFYRGFIENSLPSEWDIELIRAGKKDKVLGALKSIDWLHFPKKRVCFFVDRDLSEFLGEQLPSEENLYITDNYSIENDVVAFRTMKRVLEEVLNISELDQTEMRVIQELFESNLNTFQKVMFSVMSQILIWEKGGEKAYLDNIKPETFLKFVEGKICLNDEFNLPISRVEYAAKSAKAKRATNDELDKAEAEFWNRKGIERFIRGKYLMWFFIKFLLEIHSSIPKFCAKHSKPPKVKLPLSVENSMSVIAPRARCPESLKNFIGQNYLEYIKEVNTIVEPHLSSNSRAFSFA
jgi:hypothetical protein